MTEALEHETGTTTVGVVAEGGEASGASRASSAASASDGGVVLAADRRASLGGRFVSNKDAVKVEQVHPTAAVTIAGNVGGGQSFVRQLRARADLYETRRRKPMSMEALSTVAGDLVRGMRLQPLLAGVDDAGPHLYEVDGAGGVLSDEYGATGSGMQLAYGVLERRDPTTLDEAAAVAREAVAAATERDTASGNGIRIARVTADDVTIEADDTEV